VRIIRGKYKSRRYPVPKNFPSRPTTDFAKEGLFNILEHQYTLEDLMILDLCAGTGNISIEFLSRDAGKVIAVDRHHNCVRHIKTMAVKLGCEEDLTVINSDIIKFIKKTEQKFDLIFADPPFAYTDYEALITTIFERDLLSQNGLLIVEHGKETSLEAITHFKFMRIYGNVHFSFFEHAEEL
jgi:16S rRNA (guanine(966)-N(2))-methyltransferase RsmD